MNAKIQQLTSSLSHEIAQLDELSNPLERLNTAFSLLDRTILEVNQFLDNSEFGSDAEEINFYKIFNPEIISRKIEEGLRYNLLINRPIGTNELLIDYYKDELKALQNFFKLNMFHYQYYKNEFRELDTLYFLKNAIPASIPIPDISGNEQRIPPMSSLFAKFKAYERTQHYILELIAHERMAYSPEQKGRTILNEALKWTGDIINLVELAYGLLLTGQINNGNASLNQIVKWLEKNLEVSLGNVQKRFTEIEGRKKISNTKFLDHMKIAILKKIENGYE